MHGQRGRKRIELVEKGDYVERYCLINVNKALGAHGLNRIYE